MSLCREPIFAAHIYADSERLRMRRLWASLSPFFEFLPLPQGWRVQLRRGGPEGWDFVLEVLEAPEEYSKKLGRTVTSPRISSPVSISTFPEAQKSNPFTSF